MDRSYLFLPTPRRITYWEGEYALPAESLILLDAPQPQALRSAAARLQGVLSKAGLQWQQAASTATPPARIGLTLRVAPERAPQNEGYRLHVQPSGILIEGHEPAGVFYGICTLIQLIQQAGTALPCLEVQDWPDIPARGVMLDISRDRVHRNDYLYDLVDRLAGWKINQVQLYTEHTFAYQNHPQVWEQASPLTGEEILALDAFCRERFIELVPNQNSFGHMERWLVHPRYADLAETHDWFETPWGGYKMKGPFSLAPENPGSIALVRSLFDELLPHFTSKMVNVGCDETIDLGQGVSQAVCEERGKGRVYYDYMMKLYADLSRRGYTMQFWGDIINNDHPELAAMMPRDVIALTWGYEADHPFNVECERFANSGVPFYVCPGTATWCSLAGRTDNALGNLLNAAENGIKYGAIGFLNTDWGDRGHWQIPVASYLGFAAGAAYSWALEANRALDVAGVVGRFAFDDPSGLMGKVAYDVGNLYQAVPGQYIHNGSALFWILQQPLEVAKQYGKAVPESGEDFVSGGPATGGTTGLLASDLYKTLEAIDAAVAPLADTQMTRPDAELIQREYRHITRMMHHAVYRAILAVEGNQDGLCQKLAANLAEIEAEFRELWLARSRPGGLEDSVARLHKLAADYEE